MAEAELAVAKPENSPTTPYWTERSQPTVCEQPCQRQFLPNPNTSFRTGPVPILYLSVAAKYQISNIFVTK